MSEGSLKCCGSALFLKNRFGAGYHLRIAKSDKFNKESVEDVLHKHLPEAQLKSEINVEVVYSLESPDSDKSRNASFFPELFEELENNKENLGIESYGISITTMETSSSKSDLI